ncbi:Piso0_004660 [Millerozyma farinosa CBS 7064]|uniref:Piso0_004660 protein n=1 Tax=Pichia sorbitophila (strain ATCC MYA-4447 / BCRC 22081 / CBS 7064 / NBRC 10061 / NRRL Y-12695) TaxID=559304 RepID=G8Y9E4_PICSO|nr:Piso0_004660 [Millerozyma farinosa CBS 7064]CCE85089.1 Piso0_004660 [Millerozyma farinosa CBS 7064]
MGILYWINAKSSCGGSKSCDLTNRAWRRASTSVYMKAPSPSFHCKMPLLFMGFIARLVFQLLPFTTCCTNSCHLFSYVHAVHIRTDPRSPDNPRHSSDT